VNTFYYARAADVSSVYGRSSIILVDPAQLAGARQAMATQTLNDAAAMPGAIYEAPMQMAVEESMAMPAAEAEAQAEPTAIAIRSDFNPLALFAPEVTTDADGKATVQVKLPDNLTRYRVMVVAVDGSGKKFGSAEASITARLPLMVRPSATRFLNFGDQFDLPVVLQNQTGQDMEVEVVAEAGNLEWTGAQGMRVTVPANDRIEVRFPAKTDQAGTARIQVAAVSGDYADAAQLSLPVYTPATTEAFATYGVLDDGAAAQPLMKPEDVYAQFGGLEITTSSTALQALTDAVLYLVSYPFECSEQLASRILGVAALRDVLTAFQAEGLPSAAEMESAVKRDIERLQGLQNYDGGFPYWRRGDDSVPYNTVHVAHALLKAREMGFTVPDSMWQNVQVYLQYIENYYPAWYSRQARATISAYALYVRHLSGDSDPAKADRLLDEMGLEQLSLDAVAWIWQVLIDQSGYTDQVEQIRRHVNNRAVETAGAANFTTNYGDEEYVLLGSDRRTDALLLDAYIHDNPQSDLIPKIVNGLMAHQVRGRWNNTQENVFVLLALNSYFDAYESVEPDFVARVWLGDTYAGSSEFRGYTTDRHQIEVPMAYLLDAMEDNELQELILQKEGDGRLYYRLGLRYAPTDLQLPPVDMGFVVQRVYEAVDDADDVVLAEDGTWQIKLGARVRVRVTLVADNRHYHVALVDPLPAGLEIINPALAVSESVPADPNASQTGWWWWWRWYQHQNLRDERAEAFTPLLWEGVY
ncbi:MAG: alpha-2-macroglobulin family protein, partial [Anaerolineaceae bacterium]